MARNAYQVNYHCATDGASGRPVTYSRFCSANEQARAKKMLRGGAIKVRIMGVVDHDRRLPGGDEVYVRLEDGREIQTWLLVHEVFRGNLFVTNPSALSDWRGWADTKKKRKKVFSLWGNRNRH